MLILRLPIYAGNAIGVAVEIGLDDDRVFDAAATASAVVPGLPISDTLKRVHPEVIESAERDTTIDSILGIGEEGGRAESDG